MSRVAIIGGGIAGLSAAADLAGEHEVTVLEAEGDLAYHASARAAGMFLLDYGNGPVRALNRASAAYLHCNGILKPRGMLMVARADQHDSFVQESTAMGLSEISVSEARAMLPILNSETVAHAAYRADAFDLDTGLQVQTARRAARVAGATLLTGARVAGLSRDGGVWTIDHGAGRIEADAVVNAAGAWADQIAEMAGVAPIGFQPYRRSMAVMDAPDGHDTTHWPFVDGVEERWYAKPDAGRWLVSPSEEEPVSPHDAWADDMVLAEGLERYQEMVTTPVTRVHHSWAGLRTFAPDRALVIGSDPGIEGFYWLAGQGGYGFQTAPAAAALLADVMAGRPPALPSETVSALAPARFAKTATPHMA